MLMLMLMLPSIPELDQATFDHPAQQQRWAMRAGSFSNIPPNSNSSTHRSLKKLRNNVDASPHTQIIFHSIEEEPPLVLAKNKKPPSLLQYMSVDIDSNDDNDELMQLHLSMPPTDHESNAQSRRSSDMPSFRNLSSSFDDTIINRKYAPPSPWYAAPHESYFLGNVVGVKT